MFRFGIKSEIWLFNSHFFCFSLSLSLASSLFHLVLLFSIIEHNSKCQLKHTSEHSPVTQESKLASQHSICNTSMCVFFFGCCCWSYMSNKNCIYCVGWCVNWFQWSIFFHLSVLALNFEWEFGSNLYACRTNKRINKGATKNVVFSYLSALALVRQFGRINTYETRKIAFFS